MMTGLLFLFHIGRRHCSVFTTAIKGSNDIKCGREQPHISREIADMVKQCPTCAKDASQWREPLKVSPLPEYPWQVIGTDLFEFKRVHYILVVDYFSRYPEIIKLRITTSAAIIVALKTILSRHGIPETIRSDSGPQYSSKDLVRTNAMQHVTSSPLYPQSNGQIERAIQTVKRLLRNGADLCMALLCYRAKPLPWCDFSPTELLMGRRI